MPRVDTAKLIATLTDQVAALAAQVATLTAQPAATAEASAWHTAKDVPCPTAGDKCRRPDGTIRMYHSAQTAREHAKAYGDRKHDNSK